MTSRRAATLHITNGDQVLHLFRKAGFPGTLLGWRDGLNDGPVPAGLSLEETSSVRAQFLSQRGDAPPIKLIHEFQKRDSQIRAAEQFGEVVLWFEHDLYDQLQLLQVLTALERQNLEPGRVAVVQSDHYLGQMTVDELSRLLPRRRTATAAIFKSAGRAWSRFTSAVPDDLYAAAQEDAIGLPYLRAALVRLCEEYPAKRDGLSRSQRQALEAVAQGPAEHDELYARAQAREEALFLGDSAFGRVLTDLRTNPAPLIEGEDGRLVPTPLGKRVLAGEADWLDSAAIDRWIGGVHLRPGASVRWDDELARFVK